jgi:hypothetical protein
MPVPVPAFCQMSGSHIKYLDEEYSNESKHLYFVLRLKWTGIIWNVLTRDVHTHIFARIHIQTTSK